MCFYCKERRHILRSCPALKNKNAKPVALVSTQKALAIPVVPETDGCRNYSAFVMHGFVSLEDGGSKVPVSILRDTGASQSFILDNVLPFCEKSSVGSSIPVVGFGMDGMVVPLHAVDLESELVSGRVTVGIRPCFPIEGVSLILGNELAMGNLASAQSRMKDWFDRKASSRNFSPGDKVLVLLPIPGSSLQAWYSGPYQVVKKVGERDYVIGTPDRRRKTRLCHVNMMKQYHEQEPVEVDGEELCPSVSSKPVLAAVVLPPDTGVDVGEARLSVAVTQGKLCNSEALESLPLRLSHLIECQRGDLLA
ncbi:uncharacterized protein LOC129710578 [Leucoraja erinacea]|uniref:uncharacterized protein LOC129710578 n=1 Tax=Leucoraja erinaceus TaxID=7782 RepID=UPI002455ACD1|nr:uncharacterized protein LOC129710578 [Leucoraja erinacea]